jgi:tartrate dehydrogenase/decarboxylase / D-malate dehydrogenase
MLEHLGEGNASARLMSAVENVTGAGILTPEVGGTATTKVVTDAVVEAIHSSNV